MSKIDDKYVDALKTFTEALEDVVELLKEQQKTGKSDVVNEMLKNIPDQLKVVVEDLKKVTVEGFKSLKSDNEKIIKGIESIKKQKESGMFDRVEDPKNRNKIVDGIKVVILIAAGVLALGLAFKIIGKVDFLSVIALSTAMLLMAKTYADLSKIEGLNFRKVFMLSLILPVMAVGLVLSGWILKAFPTFTIMQGISLMLVSGALGIATYLILKSLQKISIKSLIFIPLLPIILPLIALGLVKASKILRDVVPLSLFQAFSIAIVGLALGIATIGIGFVLKSLKNVTWKEMLMLPLMIPLIAGAVVIASDIFQDFVPIKNPFQLLVGSLVIGLAILFFTPSVILLGKFIKDYKALSIGILGVIAIAGVIVAVTTIFKALPTVFNAPPFMWSLKTGIALLMFSAVALLIAVLFKTTLTATYDTGKGATATVTGGIGGDWKALAVGIGATIAISAAIVAISYIISAFKETPGISPKWTLGVGLAMLTFSAAVLLIAILMNSTLSVNYDFGKGGKASLSGSINGNLTTLGKGFLAVIGVALTLVVISQILRLMDNSTRIDPDWSLNVGITLLAFGAAAMVIGIIVQKNPAGIAYGLVAMVGIAAVVLAVDWIIKSGDYTKYPSTDWLMGVGLSIVSFGAVAVLIGLMPGGLALISIGIVGIALLAVTILAVDWIIKNGDYTKYPSKDWLLGVGLSLGSFAGLSLIAMALLVPIVIGAFSIPLLAGTMLAVDKIFSLGTFTKYPSEEWAKGVTKAMLIFSTMDGDKSLLGSITGMIKGTFGAVTSSTLIPIAMAIVAVDKILNQGKFENYPSIGWINNVTTSLRIYANTTISLAPIVEAALLANVLMMNLAISMIGIAKLLNSIDWDTMKVPSDIYMSNYQNFLLKIYETYNLIDSGNVVGLVGFTLFSTNSSTALVITSLILNQGKYDIFPSREYIDNFSYFIVVMSNTIKTADFDTDDSLVFLQSTALIVPAIENWIKMLSNGDYSNYPSFEYANNFAYFTYVIGAIVRFWLPTVESSVNFNSSIKFIVPAIKLFTTIPTMDASFFKSLYFIRLALGEMVRGISDFNSFGLTLLDFEYFDYSMRFISNAINTFSKLPIIDIAFLKNMILIKDSLIELSSGIDEFMYERVFFGLIKTKKSLTDFALFASGLKMIADGLKILTEIKPMPGNTITSFNKFLEFLNKMPKDMFLIEAKADGIKKLADSLLNLSNSISKLNSSLTGFLDMSKGLFLISIIDDVKLGNVLKSIEKHQQALKIINKAPEEQASLLSTIKSLYDSVPKKEIDTKSTEKSKEKSDFGIDKQEQFYQDISEIKGLLYQFMDHIDKPEQGASFHSK